MVAFKELDKIEPGAELDGIKKKQLWDVQRALAFLCYPVRTIDGAIGPRTRNAWAEFKEDTGEGNPTVLSASAIEALKERTKTVDELTEASLANPGQVKTAIAALCRAMGLSLKPQVAYVLATTEWETAHTFKPVKEAFWLSESWRKNHLHYYPYYGRGFVQLTWKNNYEQVLQHPRPGHGNKSRPRAAGRHRPLCSCSWIQNRNVHRTKSGGVHQFRWDRLQKRAAPHQRPRRLERHSDARRALLRRAVEQPVSDGQLEWPRMLSPLPGPHAPPLLKTGAASVAADFASPSEECDAK